MMNPWRIFEEKIFWGISSEIRTWFFGGMFGGVHRWVLEGIVEETRNVSAWISGVIFVVENR